MKKSSKRIIKLVVFSFAVVALTACGTSKNESAEDYVPPNYEEEVIFIQNYDNNHIDVIAGDVKKMYSVPENFKKMIDKVKKNDVLLIEYTLDNELKRNVTNIKVVGADKNPASKPVTKNQKPKKETKKETSEIKVYANGYWIDKQSSLMKNADKFSVQILTDYTLIGNQIESSTIPSHYVAIEELPLNTDIQPERWTASDTLKKVGELKELKGEEIYDPNFRNAEFVFTAKNNEVTKNVVVIKRDDHLLKYTMVFPSNDEGNKVQSDFWAMMWSISLN